LKLPETSLDPLKRRDDEPTFDEPWQAQALGVADALVSSGVISVDAWAEALSAALRKRFAEGANDDAELYYSAVLDAVETLLYDSGKVAPNDVSTREKQWRNAYLNTPHGQPVELSAGEKQPR
jgi:nitrile hydratase accessory protein